MTTPFDSQLEHLLNTCLSAAGANHHIRKAFSHENIFTFEDFIDICTVDNIKTFQRDDGNNIVPAFNIGNMTLINNARRYYKFLMDDGQELLAEDPVSWVKGDFRKWKMLPPVVTTTGTANVTTAATAAAATQKQEDDSFLSWRRSRKEEKDYPILNNDREFIEWRVKFVRKIHSDEMYRMIDTAVHISTINTGSDKQLWDKQTNFFSTVLECVLQTKEGNP